tara:strand:- start:214 stop:834 length:621 start_codon:yes stop_codon:yes gene_type:complete
MKTKAAQSELIETVDTDIAIARIESEEDVQSLIGEMKECLTVTVDAIRRLGAIVRRLEELKFDFSELRIPNMDYFRKIGHGRMLPEVFVSLAGKPNLLRKVSNVMIQEQQHIVDGKPVKVMLRGGDFMLAAPSDMTFDQIRQVFAADHIRNDSEQAAWLIDRDQKVTPTATASPVMLDRKRHGIVVGDTFISATDLAGYLGSLAER